MMNKHLLLDNFLSLLDLLNNLWLSTVYILDDLVELNFIVEFSLMSLMIVCKLKLNKFNYLFFNNLIIFVKTVLLFKATLSWTYYLSNIFIFLFDYCPFDFQLDYAAYRIIDLRNLFVTYSSSILLLI